MLWRGAGAQRVRNSYAPVGSSTAGHFDEEGSVGRGGGYSSDGMYNNGRAAHQVRRGSAARGAYVWTALLSGAQGAGHKSPGRCGGRPWVRLPAFARFPSGLGLSCASIILSAWIHNLVYCWFAGTHTSRPPPARAAVEAQPQQLM